MDHWMRHTTLITGAGSGIGRAVALELAGRGHYVGMIGRSLTHLRQTSRLLDKVSCPGYAAEGADVTDCSQVRTAVAHIVAKLGPLKSVITSAGIGGGNHRGKHDRWDTIIRTNLYGVYYTLTEAVPKMDSNPVNPKSFIVIGSLLSRIGIKGSTAYCASKAGLAGLVRALAIELADLNIRVNIIHPGWVMTPMAGKGLRRLAKTNKMTLEETERFYRDQVALRRMSDPSEVAHLIAFLLEGGDKGFTGAAFDMNNGAWMG